MRQCLSQKKTVKSAFRAQQIHFHYSIVREGRLAGLFKGIMSPLVCLSLYPSRSSGEPDNAQTTAGLLNGPAFTGYHFFLDVQRENDDAINAHAQSNSNRRINRLNRVDSLFPSPFPFLSSHQHYCHNTNGTCQDTDQLART